MKPLVVPREDVSSDQAILCKWLVTDGAWVKNGDPVCEVETIKITFDVTSPGDGWLIHGVNPGQEVPFNVPIGMLAEIETEIEQARLDLQATAKKALPVVESETAVPASAFTGKLTKNARLLVEEHHIPLGELPEKAIVTERDVRAILDARTSQDSRAAFFSPLDQNRDFFDPTKGRAVRTLVLGAGRGAMQVVDILLHDPRVQILGYVDDNEDLHGGTIYGFPILGALAKVEELFKSGRMDAAIISVSTSNEVRRKWYEWLKDLGIPLVNAIDPSARINRGAQLGEGNVICAFVHIGVETRIGNNNFLSANTSIDHHNIWMSHITTGPAVVTSGRVEVGDGVKMGTGIFIQPHVTIGKNAKIASGAVLTRSVPDNHVAKTRVNTVITPLV